MNWTAGLTDSLVNSTISPGHNASHTSYGTDSSPICDGRAVEELCNQPDVLIVDTIVETISLLLNIIHITVLSKFYKTPALSSRNNAISIISLTVCDLTSALTQLPLSNCLAQQLLYRNVSLCKATVIISDILVCLPLTVLSIAAIDRYLAICQPLQYSTNKFSQNYFAVMVTIWIACPIATATQNLIVNSSCVHGAKACIMFSAEIKPLYISYLCFSLLMLVLATLCLSLTFSFIFREVRRSMKNRGHDSVVYSNLQKTSCILAAMTAIFYISYLPLVIGIIAGMAGYFFNQRAWSYIRTTLNMNGIFNTLAYGWMKKSYRQNLRKMLCKRCSSGNFVRPNAVVDSSKSSTSSWM